MPFNLSTGELLVFLLVAVMVFGGNLPEVARKVGGAIADFKRGMKEEMRRMDVDAGPPPDWRPPPDGADCDGLGGTKIAPETEPAPPPPPTPRNASEENT